MRRSGRAVPMTVAAVAALWLEVGGAALAEAWCVKATTLAGVAERFPGHLGPDVVVRVDLGQQIQSAVDTAADVNGDGYIIVAAVKGGLGQPYGETRQRVVVDRTFPAPFGLVGCSLTLRDPAPAQGQPTAWITRQAAGPDIFVMDLHGAGSEVAGWLVEGDGRYLRNAYGRENGIGHWIVGDGNTLRNGVTEANAGTGILVVGNGNQVSDMRVTTNGGGGIDVAGDGNRVLKNSVGDRLKGNGGDGIRVEGAGNLIEGNKVLANGGDGLNVSGGTVADRNLIRKNVAGDRGKGNTGFGIAVQSDPGPPNVLDMVENTLRANGRGGLFVAPGATGHRLRKNISGGGPDQDNHGCEFDVPPGNVNATGNTVNGVRIPGLDGSAFPTGCLGTP